MLDDWAYFLYLPMLKLQAPPATPDHAFTVWAAEFDGIYRFGRCFVLTLHPQITGRPSRLAVLERLINHIKTRPDVAFLRAIDLAEHWIRTRA